MELAELSALADHYAAARAERLAMDKQSQKLKDVENGLKSQLIEAMKESKTSSVGGESALVTHRVKPKAVAKDWSLIHQYIKDNNAFDIMEARLATKPIQERADMQDHVPGMEWFDVDTLSVAKAKT